MNWKQENNKLIKIFSFNNQEKLAEFFLDIAKISDQIHHHADARIFQCSKLELTLFTHDENQITSKDFQLAKEIDECFKMFEISKM